MSVVLAILQAIAAIPSMKEIFDEFCSWYVDRQYEKMTEERQKAIKLAVTSFDQIPLEQAIGNPNAGEPTGISGSVVGNTPPPGLRH